MSVRGVRQAVDERLGSVETSTAALLVLHEIAFFAVGLADVESFWVDERIARDLITGHSTLELLTTLPTWPPHFPTWFAFASVVGIPAALFVSQLAHVATVYPTFRLGEAVASERAGLVAAAWVALSPYLAAQAGWLRMYGVLTALLTWTLWWGYSRQWARAAVAAVAAALVHPFGVFGGLWLALVGGGRWRRRFLLALAPAAVAGAYVLSQQGLSVGPTGVHHGIAPGALRIVLTPLSTVAGSPHSLVEAALLLVATALAAVGCRDRRLVLWVALPVVVVVGVSHGIAPVYRLKYFGYVAPAVAVLLAAQPQRRLRAVVAACVGVALGLAWLWRLTLPAIVGRRFMFWF